MVPGVFLCFFFCDFRLVCYGSRLVFIVFQCSRLAFHGWKHPKRYPLDLYLEPTISLGLAGRRPALASQFPRPTCFLSEAENLSRLWPSDYDDDGDMCYQIQNSFLKITNIVVLSLCRRIWPVFKVPSSWLWYMEVYLPRMMLRAIVPDTMIMARMMMMMLIYCFVHHEIFNRLH